MQNAKFSAAKWHSLVTLAEWQMRLSLSTPWSALPLNVIKGVSPNAIKCHLSWRKELIRTILP